MRYLWFSILLALGVRGALPLPRGLSRLDPVKKLLDARQVSSITQILPQPRLPSVAPLTTNQAPTLTSNSIPTTSNALPTTIQAAPTSNSSISLLFTQTSTSARPSSSATNTPTSAPVTDINVPFSQSKYHQMIIALSCFSVGLLVAFIVTTILALRARSDVEHLRDRLNRYEERLLLILDSDHMAEYQQTIRTMKRHPTRVGQRVRDIFPVSHPQPPGKEEWQKGTRPQAGHRRVTFSEDNHSADASTLLSSSTSRDPAPQYSQTQPLAPTPKSADLNPSPALVPSPPQWTNSPPPQSNFVSTPFTPPLVHPTSLQPRMSDPGRVATPPIRRLPTTPDTSASNHEGSGYTDPSFTSHGRSVSGGYPPH
ncbi:hypothetical protein OPQ81_008234 [Rhizoctonia solani]|nr:hypothetical protein OPQ81_008234 [Rhizoctonia solani]